MKSLIATTNDHTVALARLVLGVIFFMHGAQKTLAWFGGYGFHSTMHFFTGMGIPALFAFLAIAAEFLGGIGLIVGFLSRIAAFGIAVNMIVAIFMVHLPNGIFMNWSGNQKGEGYEYHLLALTICILIMVKGGGALSVDHALAKA
ncbi:MAG TPA: DoxX family protein [Silvibacterium sp.]|jgi:putative oxidoreductase|nr:DoxX family protein [Silvibacterium sp.]